MKHVLAMLAVIALVSGATAFTYSTDFETDTVGSMPAGWYIATPWWDVGTVTGGVADAPGGGQAMKLEWGTEWANYDFTSGEVGYTGDMTGQDLTTAVMTAEYDFYNVSDRVWQMFADQGSGVGNINLEDAPEADGRALVNGVAALTDVPIGEWVHVTHTLNAGTGAWQTAISYGSGTGGGTFSGTEDPSGITLMGEYWFGGWMFKLQSDADPAVAYDNGLFIDNFSLAVTPEPTSMLLFGLAALVLRRR
ncbi:MAG: PEP-CTERM sorting domain-containing protein [Phycisphaerae bacterium]|nr:PEP-CTERM sorting domain-containing protein [Phycisphaerae bacterium]